MNAPKHYAPEYHYTAGTYVEVGRCMDCNTIAMYEDFHPARPCFNCGAARERKEWRSAKWIPHSPWWKFWDNSGHWETAK